MRAFCALSLAATLGFISLPARADTSRSAGSFVLGASAILAGFLVGGTLIGTSDSGAAQENAGWLIIEAGFTVAPLASHADAGPWWRGVAFAAPPAIAVGGTAALFAGTPGAIEHGSIEQQRFIWSLFVAGLISGVAGVIDGALADPPATPARHLAVGPMFGRDRVGLTIGAAL